MAIVFEKNRVFIIILIVILLSSSFHMSAEIHDCYYTNNPYKFTHIDRAGRGLSYDAVKCMIQDSRGFVWIGTYKGLNRYDGTRIKSYGRNVFGQESDYINALLEDASGNILVATDNGLIIYDYSTDNFRRPVNFDILNDRIYAMCSDSEGHVWIGSRSNGLFVYEPFSETLEKYVIIDDLGNRLDNVYRLVIDDNDRKYVASYCNNLFYADKGSNVFSRVKVNDDADFFRKDDLEGLCLNFKTNNLIYVASKRHGLCEVNVNLGRIRYLHYVPEDSRPVNLEMSGKYLWLSTTSGLLRYNVVDASSIMLRSDSRDRFSLSDDYVTTVLLDDKNGLWVGTAYGGVNYHGKHQDLFAKYYKTDSGESLEGAFVCDFAQNGNDVWIATERKGLLKYNIQSGQLSRYSDLPIRLDHINALYCKNDMLWIGFHNGICRIDLKSGAMVSYPHFIVSEIDVDNRVLDIYMSSDNTLYVCTSIGVMQYDKNSDSFIKLDCLGEGAIENMAEDSRGILWLASYSSGVYAYDPVKRKTIGHWCKKCGYGNIPEMTSSVCIDESGEVWILGFGSGFFKYDAKTNDFITFDTSVISSLPSESYLSALSDDRGNLWLSSDIGLVKFSYITESVSTYTAFSGILENDFVKSSILLDDGTMMFGSCDGFIRFEPDDFQDNGNAVSVSVTDMFVGNDVVVPSEEGPIKHNIDITRIVRLGPEMNSFGFTFAVPTSDFPLGSRILCLLDGYDKKWIDVTSSKQIYYYNIPAGSYRFRLAYSNVNDQPAVAHEDIVVEVLPKFWLSRNGISLIIFFILLSCVLVFVAIYRRQEIKHRKDRHEMEQKREKEMLEEKISFFSNIVHEIKTPLTLIRTPLQNILATSKLPAIQEELAIISNSTDYLDKLVKELLDFIRVEKHGYVLEYKNIDIVDRIEYIKFNFSELARNRNLKLTFNHLQSKIICAVDPKAFDKIISNLIHNAIKYAGSYISIQAEICNGNLVVSIINDGKPIPKERREEIFKPFIKFSDDNHQYSQSFGIGLPLSRMLAELHGGTLVLSEIRDTEFILELPLKTLAELDTDEEIINECIQDKSLPLLLLVEDNNDLQIYLKRKLKSEFNVVATSSGEKAMVLLAKYKLDMVLTDIVLPGMDGLELCHRISSDIETSHIPVIVLSAISSVDVKIKAVNNGATLYIEKPFTLDYLVVCIRGILGKRRQLKDLIRKEQPEFDISTFGLVNRDEDFLKRLDKIVSERMKDPSFSVLQLEGEMNMSRSSLTRKIKELRNLTPVDYLRTKRLSAASEMLAAENCHVNEVCYAVGFSSPSYFAKCFKKHYGVLPAGYAQSLKKQRTGAGSSKDTTN